MVPDYLPVLLSRSALRNDALVLGQKSLPVCPRRHLRLDLKALHERYEPLVSRFQAQRRYFLE